MKTKLIAIVALGLAFCLPMFSRRETGLDGTRVVILKATVTSFRFVDPHVMVPCDVMDGKGNVEHWMVEASFPSRLTQVGRTPTVIKPGDKITVYLLKSLRPGSLFGRLVMIVLPDGSTLRDNTPFSQQYKPDADAVAACPSSRPVCYVPNKACVTPGVFDPTQCGASTPAIQ